MTGKWRPSLWLVVGGALAGTLALSFVGLIVLRYLGPQIGFRNAAVLIAVIIGLLTLGVGWLLVRLLLRPLQALADYAAAMRADPRQTVARPVHYGTRELHTMGDSVTAMAATLQNRAATVRSYTDHVTHELRTPVATLRAVTELLGDSATLDPDDRALVGRIESAWRQMDGQLDALRRVARAREGGYDGYCTLNDVVPGLHGELSITLHGGQVPLPIAAKGLQIVLTHLLGNAAQHGATQVHLHADDGGRKLIIVDNGPGVSDGNRGQVFTPFFTTRRDTGGTGMGLAIVEAVLQAQGASIALLDGPGARFEVRFGALSPK